VGKELDEQILVIDDIKVAINEVIAKLFKSF